MGSSPMLLMVGDMCDMQLDVHTLTSVVVYWSVVDLVAVLRKRNSQRVRVKGCKTIISYVICQESIESVHRECHDRDA